MSTRVMGVSEHPKKSPTTDEVIGPASRKANQPGRFIWQLVGVLET
jgi:hypothetical protein